MAIVKQITVALLNRKHSLQTLPAFHKLPVRNEASTQLRDDGSITCTVTVLATPFHLEFNESSSRTSVLKGGGSLSLNLCLYWRGLSI